MAQKADKGERMENDVEFKEWCVKHPKTKLVISRYRPKKYYFSQVKARPLSEKEITRAMWFLYQCDLNNRKIKRVWDKLKDFIYCLVSYQMKHLTKDQFKEMTGFYTVWGNEWNSADYEQYFDKHCKERKDYPKIRNDLSHCLCGVEITNHFYAFCDDLKLTFVIGSVCAGYGHTTVRRCKECGQITNHMRKDGQYSNLCCSCKEKYKLFYQGVPKELIGCCIDCRQWFERKFKNAPRCYKCWSAWNKKINF